MTDKLTQNKINRKRILYIVTQSDCGGAQRYIFDLATNLDKNKYQVSVATGPDGGGVLLKYLQRQQITTYQLKYLRRAINPWYDLLGLWEIIKLIKKIRPDIIHLNSSKAGVLGSLAAKIINASHLSLRVPLDKAIPSLNSITVTSVSDGIASSSRLNVVTPRNDRIKIFYTVHGFVFLEPMNWLKKQFYIWAERISAYWKNQLITVSAADRQAGINYRIAPAKKFVTIHNGINLDKIKFLSKEQALKKILPNRFQVSGFRFQVIGCLANYYPTKGLTYLIEAAREIIKAHPQTIFVLLGEGTERPILETKIKKYNLTNNFILGAQSKGWQYLSACDVFVLPSVKEGCPYAILEAMAAGCPIVATKVGGVPELLTDQQTGLLVEPKNPPQLADKINYLLNNPRIAEKLGGTAQDRVKKEFSLDKMVKETETIYNYSN